MLSEKRIIPFHIAIKHAHWQVTMLKVYLVHGMDIIVSRMVRMTNYIYCTMGNVEVQIAPQGCIESGCGYTRRFDEIISDNPCKTKRVDNTLCIADSINDSFFQAWGWLDICCRHGITLNQDNFEQVKETGEFVWFEIEYVYEKNVIQWNMSGREWGMVGRGNGIGDGYGVLGVGILNEEDRVVSF